MCGIGGWIDYEEGVLDKEKRLAQMSETLARRGPDGFGTEMSVNAALIHRRLAVIDLEGGAQPMTRNAKGERYTIVYNGELYNTEEIRAELNSRGYRFCGHSDTEVLLCAYIEWGQKCLSKLNGIFAFGIWEHVKRRLFLARDRLGVKPLFYYKYKKGLIFGSEIKTILASGKVDAVVDTQGLMQILFLAPARPQGSGIIKGVEELKPAHYMYFDMRGINTGKYWSLQAQPHADTFFLTVEKTRYLVKDAVKRQLVSDVPLATFLSGGLDSSIISKIAADSYKAKNKRLVTYSLDFENNDKNFKQNAYQPDTDEKYAAQMSAYINSIHRTIVINNIELGEALDEALRARDLAGMADIDSSLLLLSKEVSNYNKVCISGEGADEIFGGYPWYHRDELLYSDTFPWSKSLELRKRLVKDENLKKDADEWVRAHYLDTLKKADVPQGENSRDIKMREMFLLNIEWFLSTLLDRKDRMTMNSGLEVRVPFLDHRIVEYAYNMPWKYKGYNGREKGILREAFLDSLPYDITRRKKNPFPKTFSPEYEKYVTSRVRAIMKENSIFCEIIDLNSLDEYLNEAGDGEPFFGQLMRKPSVLGFLIQLDLFFKEHKIRLA